MAFYKTWAQIRDKVKNDLDLNAETFIDDAELLAIGNNAIDEAESEIHRIYEDYFLKHTTFSLVQDQKDYSLPADIFANKVRHIYYKQGQTKFYKLKVIPLNEIPFIDEGLASTTDLQYRIMNDSASAGAVFRMYPTPKAAETDVINVFYLRQANRVTADTDSVDIPEFHGFIEAYIKSEVAKKEQHPNLGVFMNDEARLRQLMKETLSMMIPDEDDRLPIDVSFYLDFDNLNRGYFW